MLDGSVPFPALTALEPAGSLIYQGTATGYLSDANNSYTLGVDANQTLALRVDSAGAATLSAKFTPTGGDEDEIAGPLNQPVYFAEAGTVTITISGLSNDSYSIQTTLNAQFDVGDDGAVIEQSLAPSTIDVSPDADVVINRAAVVGSLDPAVPRVLYEATPDNNDLRGSWDPTGPVPVGNQIWEKWSINNGLGVTGTIASKKATDDDWWWFKGQAGDTATIRTSGSSSGGGTLRATTLTLWDATSGARTPGTRVPGMASDSIIDNFELPASGFYVVIVGAASGSGTYTLTVDLTTPKDPRPNSTDAYTFYAEAGQYISFAAATGRVTVAEPKVQLALYAPGVDPVNGPPVATSSPRGTLDGLIEYPATVTGTYTVKVTAEPALTGTPTEYHLVAVSNGAFDNGVNGDFTSAQDITGRSGVLGAIATSTSPFVSAGSGGLKRAIGIDFGPDGKLFVASYNSDEVMRYNGTTGAPDGVYTSRKSPPALFVKAGLGGLDAPQYLRFGEDGNLYVVSSTKNQVFRYNGATGAFVDVFVTTSENGLTNSVGLTFGPDGELYVGGGASILCYSSEGQRLRTLDGGGLLWPEGMDFGPDGNLYVSSSGTYEVLRYNGDTGEFMDAFVPAGSGGLAEPTGLVFGPDGNLYVSSRITNEVLRYDGETGAFIDAYIPAGAAGLDRPGDLAWGPDGNLYVAGQDQSIVYRTGVADDYYKVTLSAGQSVTVSTSTPGSGAGAHVNLLDPGLQIVGPTGSGVNLTADGSGNQNVLFTADEDGAYVIRVFAEGQTAGDYVLTVRPGPGAAGVEAQSTRVRESTDYAALAAAAVYGNGVSRCDAADRIFSDFGRTARKNRCDGLAVDLVDIDYLFSK